MNDINDANDINVDCGYKDASGAHIDAYNAFKPEKFGYFPGSVDGGEKILLLSKDHKPEDPGETKRVEENGG